MAHGNSIPVGDNFYTPLRPAHTSGTEVKRLERDVDSNVGPKLRMFGAIPPVPIR